MTIEEKNQFLEKNQFSIPMKKVLALKRNGESQKIEEEDIRSIRDKRDFHLIFIRKFYANSRAVSDFKLGNTYFEFRDRNGDIIYIRTSKTIERINFNIGDFYIIQTDVRGQTIYALSNDIEVFRKGGNIISHDFRTDIFFNYSKYIEVDANFKPLID